MEPNTGTPVETKPTGSDSNTMGMLCHLLGIFTWFIGALIIWLIKKDQDEFVNDQGKEAINWQITAVIIYFAGALTACIGIGILVMIAAWVLDIIFCIMGAVTAAKGIKYRYPICIRLIK
jgi:uncharacterized protein